MIPTADILLLALLQLAIGLAGMLLRRSGLVVLCCGLVALAGVVLAFGAVLGASTSQAQALVLLLLLVTVALVGSAILYCFFRFRRTVVLDEQERLKE